MGDLPSVKRLCLSPKLDLDAGDYDGRTAMHLAASEGHLDILKQLVKHGLKDINPTDRWGNTPLDDAKRGVFQEVTDYIESIGGVLKGNKALKKKPAG